METLLHQELREIFDDLLEHFGPQHWWPGETPLEVVVGAILTQNVAWNNVEKAINNLQGKDLLSVAGLVQVPREELAELIIPTRYYNQKATRLKGFMIMVEEEFSGEMDKLLALETDELRRLLLKSKGIGKETADSILLYAADRPVFVVDAYTRRIFSRLGYVEEKVSYDEMQALFTNHLPADTDLFNEYHALIVALGKDICRARNPLSGKFYDLLILALQLLPNQLCPWYELDALYGLSQRQSGKKGITSVHHLPEESRYPFLDVFHIIFQAVKPYSTEQIPPPPRPFHFS